MKILVTRNRGGLGDVLCTMPALKGIREKYPDAHICYKTCNEYLPLFDLNPDADEFSSTKPMFGKRRERRHWAMDKYALF